MVCIGMIDGGRKVYEQEKIERNEVMMKVIKNLN